MDYIIQAALRYLFGAAARLLDGSGITIDQPLFLQALVRAKDGGYRYSIIFRTIAGDAKLFADCVLEEDRPGMLTLTRVVVTVAGEPSDHTHLRGQHVLVPLRVLPHDIVWGEPRQPASVIH